MVALEVNKHVNNEKERDAFAIEDLLGNTFSLTIFKFSFFVHTCRGVMEIDVAYKNTLYCMYFYLKKKRPDLLRDKRNNSCVLRLNF